MKVTIHESEAFFGLKAGYTINDVKKAFRLAVKRYHPDINKGKVHCNYSISDINDMKELLISYLQGRVTKDFMYGKINYNTVVKKEYNIGDNIMEYVGK